MELREILAISGQPGLYKFIAQSKNGIIVESLSDGKRFNAPASSKVSSMGEIAIFTDTDEKPLAEVFESLYANAGGKETISHKSSNEQLKAKFAEILPDYDRDRVHVSDMKKVFSWYNILVAAGMTKFVDDKADEENAEGESSSEPAEKSGDNSAEE